MSFAFRFAVLGPVLGLVLAGLCALPATARDLFVAPPGSPVADPADGSRAAPFASLRSAASARDGAQDRIVLLDGEYGEMTLYEDYEPPLTIAADTPGGARFSKILLNGGKGTRLSGLMVYKHASGPTYTLVESRVADVMLDGLDLRGSLDAPDSYLSWTAADWRDNAVHGVQLKGRDNTLTNSRLTGTAFAIQAMAPGARVIGNRVAGFSGDGMRATGDGSLFADNRVENCIDLQDGNHDDGFQAWAPKPEDGGPRLLRDLVLDGNVILEWTGPEDHPLHGRLQGIGLFDGRYENVTVQNNLVVVDHYHGITLTDAFDSRILNNTVVSRGGKRQPHPWVSLATKRDDPEALRNVQVVNNVAMSFRNISGANQHNGVASQPARMFADPGQGDFRPAPDSPLLGAGQAAAAAPRDILGHVRPTSGRVALGAFEAPAP